MLLKLSVLVLSVLVLSGQADAERRSGELSTKSLSTRALRRRLRSGGNGGLAGGFGGFDVAGVDAAALVRQPTRTVRVDAGVRELFDAGAFRFMETLDAATHGMKGWVKGEE